MDGMSLATFLLNNFFNGMTKTSSFIVTRKLNSITKINFPLQTPPTQLQGLLRTLKV